MSRSATSNTTRKGAVRQPQQPQPERLFDEYSAYSNPGLLLKRNPTEESGPVLRFSQSHRESS
jgi:hypothetical protein